MTGICLKWHLIFLPSFLVVFVCTAHFTSVSPTVLVLLNQIYFFFVTFPNVLFYLFLFLQVEHLPILIDSPKKLDHQLSSDPDNTPVSNAANSDSETDDISQPGELKLVCRLYASLMRFFMEKPGEYSSLRTEANAFTRWRSRPSGFYRFVPHSWESGWLRANVISVLVWRKTRPN